MRDHVSLDGLPEGERGLNRGRPTGSGRVLMKLAL